MIITIGEALIDVVDRGDGTPEPHVGGSPLNVATGLARMGLNVTLGTTIGNDAYGAMIAKRLADNSVAHFQMTTMENTSVALAKLDSDGIASYEFRIDWAPTQTPPITDEVLALHTGSLATVLRPGAELVMQLLKQEHVAERVTLTYDPNVRPALMGEHAEALAQVESIVSLVDVVKASDEDLEWLYPGKPYVEVAKSWFGLGPAIVIVTRGHHGAYAITARGELEIEAPKVDVIDTVGAGDSFMSTVIYTLSQLQLLGGKNRSALHNIKAESLRLVLSRAIEVAAITVGRAGANPPTIAEVSFTDQ